jgi:hypothetical protein
MNQESSSPSYRSFWHKKHRRYLFLGGAFFVALGVAFVIFISNLREASVIDIQSGADSCKENDRSSVLVYSVNGKNYTMSACLPGPIGSVSYLPANPSIALINSITVNYVVAGGLAAVGAIVMFGAVFLRDPRPGEVGYSSSLDR